MRAYSTPERESDPYALPDIEVFHSALYPREAGDTPLEDGYYWWPCFPGCLPDGEPVGPFASQDEALADARSF